MSLSVEESGLSGVLSIHEDLLIWFGTSLVLNRACVSLKNLSEGNCARWPLCLENGLYRNGQYPYSLSLVFEVKNKFHQRNLPLSIFLNQQSIDKLKARYFRMQEWLAPESKLSKEYKLHKEGPWENVDDVYVTLKAGLLHYMEQARLKPHA